MISKLIPYLFGRLSGVPTEFYNGIGGFSVPAGSSGGGLTLLESHDASSSADLTFSTRNAAGQSGATFQSDFDDYILRIISLIPSTALADLFLEISVNAGVNWNVANCHYAIVDTNLTGIGLLGGGNPSATGCLMALNVDGTSGVNGQIDIYTPLDTVLDKQMILRTAFRTGANYENYAGSAIYLSTAAIDQIRLIPNAGVLLSGSVRMYGVKK